MLELLLPAAVPALSLIMTQVIKYGWGKVAGKIPPAFVPVIASVLGALIDYLPMIGTGNPVAGALLGLAATGAHQVYSLAGGSGKK